MCTNGQLDNTDGVFAPYNYTRRMNDPHGSVNSFKHKVVPVTDGNKDISHTGTEESMPMGPTCSIKRGESGI